MIIDTNVVIAGLATANGPGRFAPVLEGMLNGAFSYAVSDTLLREYRSILARPALLARLGMTTAQVDGLVDDLARAAIHLQPVPAPRSPDPGDQFLWQLLAAHPELLLVTDDRLLLAKGKMRHRTITPETFVASLAGSSH